MMMFGSDGGNIAGGQEANNDPGHQYSRGQTKHICSQLLLLTRQPGLGGGDGGIGKGMGLFWEFHGFQSTSCDTATCRKRRAALNWTNDMGAE